MKLKKLAAACTVALASMFGVATTAQAQISGDVIRIGFITDMSSLYADIDGPAGVEAIRMAVADMGGAINGKKIEVIYADHQNKADVAAAKAREWFDTQGLDMLIGGTNSGTALAMAKVAAEKKKPFIVVGAASSALTNEQCNPYTLHWAYDTVALAKGTGNAVVKAGGKTGTS
jgi:branched-chain amino acid transport system substrate-binding protein